MPPSAPVMMQPRPFSVALVLVVSACSTSVASGETASQTTEPSAASTSTSAVPDIAPITVATTQPATTVATAAPTTPPTTAPPATAPPVTEAPEDRSVPVADPPIEAVRTDRGDATQRAQERLLQLGYWLNDPPGDYGVTTGQAVLAFQKFNGLETDGSIGPITAAALTAATERPSGRADTGTLVEIDKTSQLGFFVVDGSTQWIVNTSTGTEVAYREPDQNDPGLFDEGDAVTRTGLFRVNRERAEGWWEGDLGEIYRPKYFDGGIALHGSYNIPDHPASHGCVRLSIPLMDWIWDTDAVPMGTPVWVYGAIPASAVAPPVDA